LLERNLAYFQEKHPALYDRLRKTTPIELEKTRKGTSYTAKIDNIYIHSSFDPVAESKRKILAFAPSLKDSLMFIGLGLGYDLMAFDDLHDVDIIILENRLDVLRSSLNIVDYERIGKNNRFYFITEPDTQAVSKIPLKQGLLRIDNKPLVNTDKTGFYEKVMALLAERLKREVADLNTTGYFSKIWLRNSVSNILRLRDSFSLTKIHGKFSSFPAAVVSSGPTLEQTISQLIPYTDKCVIIATASAARRLAKEHIEPHFILSTDGGYYSSWQLRNLNFQNSLLVTDLSVHKGTHEQHKGNRAFFSSGLSYLDYFLPEKSKSMPELPMQGTVAATAIMFASYIGCLEVFLFGQDVGFPFNMTHCRGTIASTYRSQRTYRMNSLESMDMKEIIEGRCELDRDYEGRRLLSDFKLKLYKEWFSSVRMRLYQTSPKAAFIPSIPTGKLKESIPKTGSVRAALNSVQSKEPVHFNREKATEEVENFLEMTEKSGDINSLFSALPPDLAKGVKDYASFEMFRLNRGLTEEDNVRQKIKEYFQTCLKAWKNR